MNHFELPQPSDEMIYVDIYFSLTCAFPDTYDGKLIFEETSHDHTVRVKVPANYASDNDLLRSYVQKTLYESGADIASACVYGAKICTTN